MKASVVYVSNTGNTESLAMAIREELQNCLHCGAPSNEALAADLVFAGFWTDRGTCPEELRDFLGKLHGKTVALFGTAGFGGSKEYFERLLATVEALVPADNTLADGFMCQGKMPMTVRERYVKMGNTQGVENFDRALAHPDHADLTAVRAWARGIADNAAEGTPNAKR